MKTCCLLFILTVLLFRDALAQRVLLEKDVAEDTVVQTFGPNLKHYAHGYVGFGLVVGPSEGNGSAVEYPGSNEISAGFRYKFKVGKLYALGLEAQVTPQVFKIKQEPAKTLPNTDLHEEEKLKFLNLGLGFFNRFNWDKRGNYVGNFLDLGVYGNWIANSAHVFRDKVKSSPPAAERVKTRVSGLKYVEDLQYGFLTRIGLNRYVFYANYRLSGLFDKDHTYTNGDGTRKPGFGELPRYTLGFQLSLHK